MEISEVYNSAAETEGNEATIASFSKSCELTPSAPIWVEEALKYYKTLREKLVT